MQPIHAGRYLARLADSNEDVGRVQALRWQAFGLGPDGGRDHDRFDRLCDHVLIEEAGTGQLVATFRLLFLPSGRTIETCYSAQFYDLERLSGIDRPLIEIGRFCLRPDRHDPDILRLGWAAITACVDKLSAGLLIGCSSFSGTDPCPYRDVFAHLARHHLAPPILRPGRRAPETIALEATGVDPDPGRALRAMPPLLRSYLSMGGWVSDHAVIDRKMGTLHVFTGLEVSLVPETRARSLRRLVQADPV